MSLAAATVLKEWALPLAGLHGCPCVGGLRKPLLELQASSIRGINGKREFEEDYFMIRKAGQPTTSAMIVAVVTLRLVLHVISWIILCICICKCVSM